MAEILKKPTETLSDAFLRWSLHFNENLELDRKDEKTIESYMNTVNKLIEYVSSDKTLDKLSFEELDTKFIKKFFF